MIDITAIQEQPDAFREVLHQSGVARDELCIAAGLASTADPRAELQRLLAAFGVDYVDLVLIKTIPKGTACWQELAALREEGLLLDIGVSDHTAEEIDALIDVIGEAPVANSLPWSPFAYSNALQAHHRAREIVILAQHPLGHRHRLDDPVPDEIARAQECTAAQVMLRWHLQRGTVPLSRVTDVLHVDENFAVFDFALSDDEMARLDGLNRAGTGEKGHD